ncbi:MAG TPA: YggT family protein [Acidimicrobiia bacterium]
MKSIICALLQVYFLVLIGRIILSWFPVRPGTAMASIASILFELTEPVLGPLRRVIPPLGMFDLSPLVAFLGIQIIQGPVLHCGRVGLF